jgi:hypothetical protein
LNSAGGETAGSDGEAETVGSAGGDGLSFPFNKPQDDKSSSAAAAIIRVSFFIFSSDLLFSVHSYSSFCRFKTGTSQAAVLSSIIFLLIKINQRASKNFIREFTQNK